MVFSPGINYGNGQWHCPFSREWVERMSRAAKICARMTDGQVAAAVKRIEDGEFFLESFDLPPGNFLDGPQDARGLPLSWCREEEQRYMKYSSCCATYDYKSIPDVVITNGREDWPLKIWK